MLVGWVGLVALLGMVANIVLFTLWFVEFMGGIPSLLIKSTLIHGSLIINVFLLELWI